MINISILGLSHQGLVFAAFFAKLNLKVICFDNKINRIKIETELGEYLNLPIKTYSSGMKFRLAFFTSLNVQSDILLLDEWIGTADQNLRDKVDKLILERIAKSKITLIASHNLDRLKKICNNIIYFEKGEISKIKTG